MEENKNRKSKLKIRRSLKFLVKLAISLTALYFVLRKVDIAQIGHLYAGSELFYLMPALCFFILSKIISAFRLNHLFQQIGVNLGNITNLKLYWLGMFYNMFLPGGIGGDGYKIYLIKKQYKIRIKTVLAAIFVDRANGLFMILLLSFLFFSLLIEHRVTQIIFLTLVPVGYLICMVVMKRWFAIFKKFIHRINLYSFAVQLAQIIMVLLILKSWNVDNHLIIYVSVFLISSLIAILPITIGGAGARELTFLFFTNYFSFDLNIAIAMSLMFYLITLLVSFGGIVYSLNPIKLNPLTHKAEIHKTVI